MSHPYHRKPVLTRALSAVAAFMITASIVQGLDILADHSSAATLAGNSKAPVLMARR